MYTVNYKKSFLTGNLKGFTVDESVIFPTKESATRFMDSLLLGTKSDVITGSKWLVSNIEISNNSQQMRVIYQ